MPPFAAAGKPPTGAVDGGGMAAPTEQLVLQEFGDCSALLEKYLGRDADTFRAEYTQLFQAAQDSRDGESAALKKIEQVSTELNACRDELATLDTYEEDAKATRMNRAVALDTLRQQYTDMQLRQEAHREQTKLLYEGIELLKAEAERGPGWREDQEASRRKLVAEIADLRRQLEITQKDHDGIKTGLSRVTEHVEREEGALAKRQAALAQLEARQALRREECEAEQSRRIDAERELVLGQEAVFRDQGICQTKQVGLVQQLEAIARMETQLRESKESMEKYLAEYDVLFKTIQHLSDELDGQIASNDRARLENTERRAAVAGKEAAVAALRQQEARLRRQRDAAAMAITRSEEERQAHERKAEDLRAEVARVAGEELKAELRAADGLVRQVANLRREKEILERKVSTSEGGAAATLDLVEINLSMRKSLADEASKYRASVADTRRQIENLLATQREHNVMAAQHGEQHRALADRLQQQEAEAAALQRRIASGAVRLKQQQNLYEAVRGDRNGYSKDLVEIQDEIREMRRSFKVMNHQIEQLKEEITSKDHALVREHFHHHNVDKDREALRNDVAKLRKQIGASEHVADNQRAEVLKLGRIISEADAELQRQTKEHDAILGEKHILTAQLTARGEELAAAYERVRMQVAELHHGEARCDKLREERAATEARVAAMARELRDSLAQVGSAVELVAARAGLDRALLQEHNKVRALAGELEQPLNVHRWRGLESSDPRRFELVCRARALQARLGDRAARLQRREALVKGREALYGELRRVLARRPGPAAAEQLQACRESLKGKAKQMRALEEELGMYRQQATVLQREIQAVNRDATALRQNWVEHQLRHEQ